MFLSQKVLLSNPNEVDLSISVEVSFLVVVHVMELRKWEPEA